MTVVTVVFWIVTALWAAVAACVLVMICDLEREWRAKRAPPPPPPLPVPPLRLPAGGVYRNQEGVIFFNDLNPPVTMWIRAPMVMEPMRMTDEAREQMIRMQNQMVRQAMQGFRFGSQSFAFGCADRCDICGARIIQRHHDKTILFYEPYKDSKRCQGLCGWQKSETQRDADRLESRNEGQLSVPSRLPPPRNAV